MSIASIHVGIGGWTFPPWRGAFYPPGLPHARELEYASSKLTAIEINGTFYRTQTPASFARWAAETPDGFVFAVKAPRVATYRNALHEAEPSIARFLGSGLTELGAKLGPLLWQFPPTRTFDTAAMEGFLALLPASQGGIPLRHVVEARHPSFGDPAWIALLRRFGVAHAIVERDDSPLGDVTADFVYARLQRNDAAAPHGYADAALEAWAGRLRAWAAGRKVDDLRCVVPVAKGRPPPRDCFAFFISGDKIRAPDAAMAMLARLAA
jgi:uncharacterized protein YecE (DUF72 family)